MPPSPQSALAATALAGILLGARAGYADDSCASANDGACDELTTCGLDTDTRDCAAACSAPWPEGLVGACAHYAAAAAVSAPPPPADVGSHGSGGPGGLWEDTIRAKWTKPDSETDRYYMVYVPPTYDPAVPTPLLYMFSGNYVDMYTLIWYTELLRTADLNGFLLAFPQQPYSGSMASGYSYSWIIYQQNWQGGAWPDCPEIDFVRKLTAHLKSLYNVDRTRIYASGHSRGSALSIMLAFEMTDTIAGFVSEMGFIGAQKYDMRMKEIWKPGDRKIPGFLVHGRPDPDVPFANSEYIAKVLTDLGWVENQDFIFYRFDNVTHEWQHQYNQQIWDFMNEHPLPLDKAAL